MDLFKNQNSDAGANVVVNCNRREKLKAVSDTVWVCWKNEWIKIIFTIITI